MGENTSKARAITFPYVGEIKGSKVWHNAETGVEIIKGANFAEVGLYYVCIPALDERVRLCVTQAQTLPGAREAALRHVVRFREAIAEAYAEALAEDGARRDRADGVEYAGMHTFRDSGSRECAYPDCNASVFAPQHRVSDIDPDSLIGKRVRIAGPAGLHGEVRNDFGGSVTVRIDAERVVTTSKLNVSLIEGDEPIERAQRDRRNARIMVDFVSVAVSAPEQLTAWRDRHGIALGPDTAVEHYIDAYEADHAEAYEYDAPFRIVRRAQYDALREMLRQVDGWECQGAGLSAEVRQRGQLAANAFREMINTTARTLGVREPWQGDRS